MDPGDEHPRQGHTRRPPGGACAVDPAGAGQGHDGRPVADERADIRVARLASRQDGIASREELLEAGLSRAAIDQRLRTGRLHALHRAVYAVGHRALTPRAHVRAALKAVPGAVVSDRAAAFLLGFGPPVPPPIDVIVGPTRQARRSDVRVHRRTLSRGETTTRHALPVTTPGVTLLHLAARTSERELEHLLSEAFALRLTSRPALLAVLAAHPRAAGARRLRVMLEADVHRARSHPERDLLRHIRRAQLPAAELNLHEGAWTPDLVWPDLGLVVEIDGYASHSSPRAFARDRHKDRHQRNNGRETLRVTANEIRDEPFAVVADVARGIERAMRERRAPAWRP